MTWAEDATQLAVDRFGLEVCEHEGPEVGADQLVAFARALKDELDFCFFVYVVSVHYPQVPPVEADAEAGTEAIPGIPDRTVVNYRARRLANADRPTETFAFRTTVPTGESCPSVSSVWVGADWQEREQFDLVGTVFSDHPDLRRIMMPEDWPGHPLRRDYAIDTSHFPWR
jgi:NADH:ubiquinone oxidoreductase subunit C